VKGVELVLRGGAIVTHDAARPRVRALAADGGRIVAVGDDAEMAAHIGARTRVIELAGRTVLPALTDGHAHLYCLGCALGELDLDGCRSPAECVARVAAAPPGEWLLGRGWDQNRFADARFPAHAALDAAAPDRPVWLRRIDGHAGWANARALALAGVTAATPDPPGGRILREASGAPSGVLVDAAMALVDRVVPPPDDGAREQAILRAQAVALENGLTGVHEMGIDAATVAAYRRLARDGRLRLRVYAFAEAADALALLARDPDPPAEDARFLVRGIKLFADGALGSRGAALLVPYNDDPHNLGLILTPVEVLERVAARALERGWQVAVHAIGDRANRMVLDAYARAGCAAGRDHRFRVEHAQVLAPGDLERLARLGVVASMQPTHATSDLLWAEARLGRERLAGAYAWRRVLDAGVRLVGGSDFPVEGPSPLAGLYAAVTGGGRPEQKLTLDEAIRAFSLDAAFGAFEERWRGRAAPGQAADLTVLDRDLLDAPPRALLDAKIDFTIVGGRVVYARR
jgi:predicted amidohydrolase YtcJ